MTFKKSIVIIKTETTNVTFAMIAIATIIAVFTTMPGSAFGDLTNNSDRFVMIQGSELMNSAETPC